jgi:hypothetical protein
VWIAPALALHYLTAASLFRISYSADRAFTKRLALFYFTGRTYSTFIAWISSDVYVLRKERIIHKDIQV